MKRFLVRLALIDSRDAGNPMHVQAWQFAYSAESAARAYELAILMDYPHHKVSNYNVSWSAN